MWLDADIDWRNYLYGDWRAKWYSTTPERRLDGQYSTGVPSPSIAHGPANWEDMRQERPGGIYPGNRYWRQMWAYSVAYEEWSSGIHVRLVVRATRNFHLEIDGTPEPHQAAWDHHAIRRHNGFYRGRIDNHPAIGNLLWNLLVARRPPCTEPDTASFYAEVVSYVEDDQETSGAYWTSTKCAPFPNEGREAVWRLISEVTGGAVPGNWPALLGPTQSSAPNFELGRSPRDNSRSGGGGKAGHHE